jgi:hypothetical protein
LLIEEGIMGSDVKLDLSPGAGVPDVGSRPFALAFGAFWVAAILAVVLAFFMGRPPIIAQRTAQIAADSKAYCEKWGMPAGTSQHADCIRDLTEIRHQQARRDAEDAMP